MLRRKENTEGMTLSVEIHQVRGHHSSAAHDLSPLGCVVLSPAKLPMLPSSTTLQFADTLT